MVLAIPHQPTPDITYCPQTYNFPPNEKLTKKPHLNLGLGLSGELQRVPTIHSHSLGKMEKSSKYYLFSALLAILGVRCAVIIVILIV